MTEDSQHTPLGQSETSDGTVVLRCGGDKLMTEHRGHNGDRPVGQSGSLGIVPGGWFSQRLSEPERRSTALELAWEAFATFQSTGKMRDRMEAAIRAYELALWGQSVSS